MLWLAIVGGDDLRGDLGREVDGAPAEVLDLFGVAKGPGGVGDFCLVTGVGAGDGESALEIGGELLVAEGAGEASVADAEVAAVPTLLRQPDFKADLRVAGGAQDAGDAAEGGEIAERGRDACNC